MSKYTDKRESFWKENFSRALPYETYVTGSSFTGSSFEGKWRACQSEISSLKVPSVLQTMTRKMPVLVLSAIWCGDCSRQGPLLNKIQEANSLFEFRFAESSEFLELKEELKINGAEKVPVIVALNEDFHEVARFGDRHLSVYRDKLSTELGAACDAGILPPEISALQEEFQEWVDFLERLQIMLRLAPGLRKRHRD